MLRVFSDEERVHAGEFLRLLKELEPDEERFYREGAEAQAFEFDTMWLPDAFLGPMSDLMDAIASGREPTTDGRKMLPTLAIGEAAYRSAEERRSVRLTEITGLVP